MELGARRPSLQGGTGWSNGYISVEYCVIAQGSAADGKSFQVYYGKAIRE